MASNVPPGTHYETPTEPTDIPHTNPSLPSSAGMSSTPVELSNLESQSRPIASHNDEQPTVPNVPSSAEPTQNVDTAVSSRPTSALKSIPTTESASLEPPTSTEPTSTTVIPAPVKRKESTAIGPPSDKPIILPKEPESAGPVLVITLLLITGARHPYKIDEKYLKKRNVSPTDMDPFNLSVYTLKELIWREWREEWEPRPTAPTSIRLIHFGRLLDDKSPLNDCKFNHDSPNVVHMTVKPQEVVDDEDAKMTKQGPGRDREGNERSPGCRCIIQ
ncbi:MAG: hypothetical protein M1836_006307 [Candelina mexicana]|nr:MAG: hypothetical protein M1836_006307 [Candelina mexicana]